MKPISSLNSQQSGFTLVEVMVSVLIFMIGVLGLVALQGVATQTSVDAEDRGRASLLANELVAQVWTNNTIALPAAVISGWQTSLAQATAPSSVTAGQGIAGYGISSAVGTYTCTDGTTTMTACPNTTAVITITWTGKSKTSNAHTYITEVTIP